MSELKLVRLSSGEEIVGQVTRTETTTTITNGWNLVATGEGRMGFIPFMQYTKAADGVEVSNDFVMFVVDPVEELVDQIRTLETGIVTPDTKLITG